MSTVRSNLAYGDKSLEKMSNSTQTSLICGNSRESGTVNPVSKHHNVGLGIE